MSITEGYQPEGDADPKQATPRRSGLLPSPNDNHDPQPVVLVLISVNDLPPPPGMMSALKKSADAFRPVFNRAGWKHVLYQITDGPTHFEVLTAKDIGDAKILELQKIVDESVATVKTRWG